MFSDLNVFQQLILYKALVYAVTTNSGIGFHNSDQGHPAYRRGRSGDVDFNTWGDSPQNNELFQMVAALSSLLGQSAQPSIKTWEEFCVLATDSYQAAKGKP